MTTAKAQLRLDGTRQLELGEVAQKRGGSAAPISDYEDAGPPSPPETCWLPLPTQCMKCQASTQTGLLVGGYYEPRCRVHLKVKVKK